MNGRKPLLAEQDQRYWRRRANRRVRKARLTRNLVHGSLVLLVNGAIAAALLLAGARTLDRATHSDEFSLRHVKIDGAQRASVPRIRAALQRYLGQNLLDLDLLGIEVAARRDPWVRGTMVKRILPATLRLTIVERTPVATALIDGKAHVLDTSGYVIGPAGVGLSDDLPVLTGLEGMDEASLIAALRRGARLTLRLQRASASFINEVSELDLARDDRVTVTTVRQGPKILLDPDRIERNIEQYLQLRRGIENRVGPASYVDLRWRDRISVMPAVHSSFERGR
jgi:cell division septal protein FtsQ